MYSLQFLLRVAKTLSVASIALMSLLIVFGNVTDYWTNFLIAEHVLKMDTTFPQSHIHYRSIHSTFLFHAGYILIIVLETLMAFCCIKGSWLLFKNLRSNAALFHASKNGAVAGIIIGIVIWFLGFEVVGANGLLCGKAAFGMV